MNNLFISTDGKLRPGWRFVLAVIVVIAAFLAAGLIASSISRNIAIFETINRPLAAIFLFLVFFFFSRVLDEASRPADHLGLNPRRPWLKEWFAGICCGFLLVSAAVALIALVGHYSVDRRPALSVSRWTAVSVVTWILFAGAITEELAFRSYPFLALREALSNLGRLLRAKQPEVVGAWTASIFTGLLFGAIHLGNPNATLWSFIDTVLIGILFGILMARAGSLWLLWGLHFGWNVSLGLLFGLPVSGVKQFSVLWTGAAEGPKWLTGGDYGIEASATVAMVILITLFAVSFRWSPVATSQPDGIQPK
jgi:membrane protease YdiL (CAAX protease family)